MNMHVILNNVCKLIFKHPNVKMMPRARPLRLPHFSEKQFKRQISGLFQPTELPLCASFPFLPCFEICGPSWTSFMACFQFLTSK